MNVDRLTADQSSDLDEFLLLVFTTLRAAWGAEWGTFCEAFPNGKDPLNINLPVITYKINSMMPGLVNDKGLREIKPRYRQDIIPIASGQNDAERYNIYAQWFDYDIAFEVWEENNDRLGALSNRFHEFMMTYAGYFKQKGVGEIIFKEMVSDYEVDRWRDNIVSRRYCYYVRLEKQVVVPTYVIKEIIGKVELYKSTIVSDQNIESIKFESNKGGNLDGTIS